MLNFIFPPKITPTFCRGMMTPKDISTWFAENPSTCGFVFTGRSNVGKSSLINVLFQTSISRTSKKPGKTKEINVFEFFLEESRTRKKVGPFYLFDLPGHGHASVAKLLKESWMKNIDFFFSCLPSSVAVICLQDARHPLQPTDLIFMDYIKNFYLKSFLTFNKIDQLKNQQERHQFSQFLKNAHKQLKVFQEIHQVSAMKKMGIDGLQNTLKSFLLLETERKLQQLSED